VSGSDKSGWLAASAQHLERGMAAWWDRVLETPEVLQAMNQALGAEVDGRRSLQRTGQRMMEKMNLPTRHDLSRLLRITTLLEERLLSIDDRLLDMHDRVIAAEKEAIRARVEAAEARLELAETLAALEARLGGGDGGRG
jgi:hypothetical protein